jgi:citrate synthase
MSARNPTTALCHYDASHVFYREKDLVGDLIGKAGFVEVMLAQVLGRAVTPAEATVVEAIMVAGMEHGFTPSAIAARLTYTGAPESIQGAIAAGLLGAGDQFLGAMQGCAEILARVVSQGEPGCGALVAEYRAAGRQLPGFGHHLHRPDDPRALALLDLARSTAVAGRHVEAALRLQRVLSADRDRHVTINAAGATAAILADLAVPAAAMRGLAVVARAAGLLAHIIEERMRPTGRFIWDLVDRAVPYSTET